MLRGIEGQDILVLIIATQSLSAIESSTEITSFLRHPASEPTITPRPNKTISLKWPLGGNPNQRKMLTYRFGTHWDLKTEKSNGYCITPGLEDKKLHHTGVDYAAKLKDKVYAAHAGKIVHSKSDNVWGGYVVIEAHDKTFTTTYTHVLPSVPEGEDVLAGDPIGTIADIFPNKPHLHFQIRLTSYHPTWSLRGRLPEVRCIAVNDGNNLSEPAFPESFVNPEAISWR